MSSNWFGQLNALLAGQGFHSVVPDEPGSVRFLKDGVTVESRDQGETFVVRHGPTIRICQSVADLASYLNGIS